MNSVFLRMIPLFFLAWGPCGEAFAEPFGSTSDPDFRFDGVGRVRIEVVDSNEVPILTGYLSAARIRSTWSRGTSPPPPLTPSRIVRIGLLAANQMVGMVSCISGCAAAVPPMIELAASGELSSTGVAFASAGVALRALGVTSIAADWFYLHGLNGVPVFTVTDGESRVLSPGFARDALEAMIQSNGRALESILSRHRNGEYRLNRLVLFDADPARPGTVFDVRLEYASGQIGLLSRLPSNSAPDFRDHCATIFARWLLR